MTSTTAGFAGGTVLLSGIITPCGPLCLAVGGALEVTSTGLDSVAALIECVDGGGSIGHAQPVLQGRRFL